MLSFTKFVLQTAVKFEQCGSKLPSKCANGNLASKILFYVIMQFIIMGDSYNVNTLRLLLLLSQPLFYMHTLIATCDVFQYITQVTVSIETVGGVWK